MPFPCGCFHLLNALHFHACCSAASKSPVRIHSSARNVIAFHCPFLMQRCYSFSAADKTFKTAWNVIKCTEHKQFSVNCWNSVQASVLSASLMLTGSDFIFCYTFLLSVSDKSVTNILMVSQSQKLNFHEAGS